MDMATERWRPWDEFREMERWMDEMMRRPQATWRRPLTWWRVPTEAVGWMPGVEMYEKADKFIVRAELPGMKKKEIDVSVVGNTLTISGERKAETEVKDEDYYRCELCYGKFSRPVGLPAAVDPAKVDASYENGILEITLPKVEAAKPKRITVKTKETKAKK
ncbi:Hsp20/alpha crystallin family protein [Chloroflexota bacterium]